MIGVKYLLLGFFVKVITGFDDTLTRVPIVASVTKTRLGKIAFSIGTFLAIVAAIVVSVVFAGVIKSIPYARYISAGLIFALALAVYFDVFVHKPREKAEKKLVKKVKRISAERFFKLIGIGFIATAVTMIDDIIAYAPLFLGPMIYFPYSILGILVAGVLEIVAAVYFAEKIDRFRYKEEFATAGLILVGILTLVGFI